MLAAGLALELVPSIGRAVEEPETRACEALFEARAYPQAQECFERRVALNGLNGANPTNPAIPVSTANGAPSAHDANTARGDDIEAMAYLGRTYLARRRAAQAVDWLQRAVQRAPARSDLHDWLAQALGISAQRAPLVRQLGLAVKAGKEFARAVELDAANLDALDDLIEFQIEAPAVLGGSLAKARAHAAEMLQRDRLRGRLALARVLLRAEGLAAAEHELAGAAADFPADPRPPAALGGMLTDAGQYERAFAAFDAALRLDPDNADAQLGLGRAAALSGQRLQAAEEMLGRYLQRLPPGDTAALADCHLELAALDEKRHAARRARAEYEAVLRLDPDSPEARGALRRLARTGLAR